MNKLQPIVENQLPRGLDPTGFGHYGANRGTRKHKGYDIITTPGQQIVSPLDGVISKIGYPYANALQFRYIDINGSVYRVRLMYVLPDPDLKVGTRIFICSPIATAQDIAGYWNPKMINHAHIEVYKHGLLTDPEPLF